MIRISFLYDEMNTVTGFDFEGHAGYDRAGRDIVCASVSALVLNTLNSIEKLTKSEFTCEMDKEKGRISFRLKDRGDEKTELLLKSLKLGIGEIRKNYGSKYIKIEK